MKAKFLIFLIIFLLISRSIIYSYSEWSLDEINLIDANNITRGSQDVIVAIIDSGIDTDNHEFRDKIVKEYNIIEKNKNVDDNNGHGTSIASIIAANDDGIGVEGVAPNIKIMPVKIFDTVAEMKNLVAGLQYAVDNGVDIVNCSTIIEPPKKGRYTFDFKNFRIIDNYYETYKNNEIRKIIRDNPDVLFIFPSGNIMESNALFPARYKEDNIISVGASDEKRNIWKGNLFNRIGSNYNNENVDLLAPGVNIQTIGLNGLEKNTGTSMSAAYVSGVAALIKSEYKELSPIDIKNAILKSVNKNKKLEKKVLSSGILDAYKALREAKKLIR